MQAFLINLERRPDRMRAMAAQLARLGIEYAPVAAVDAKSVDVDKITPSFTAGGPLGPIAKGDRCCAKSHVRAWEAFLASGEEYGIVLEDDVLLHASSAELLRDGDWIPRTVGLLKLEHYGPRGQRILIGESINILSRWRAAEIWSRHTGAAAYILSRDVARHLLSLTDPWSLPVDHLLFNPNISPVFAAIRPYQLMPAIARQSASIGGRSDIEEWREPLRQFSWAYLKREAVRASNDLRALPRQVASVAVQTAKFVRIEMNAEQPDEGERARPRTLPDKSAA